MFNPIISWPTFFLICVAATIIYYLFLSYVLHHSKLSFNRKYNEPVSQQPSKGDDSNLKEYENELSIVINNLVNEIRVYLQQSAAENCRKEDLLQMLPLLLKKYPVKNSGYQLGISNLISAECEMTCNIHMTPDELTQIWNY
ncbi:MAG: hypothetical protein V4717_14490 [Bacteroidota bacterium]